MAIQHPPADAEAPSSSSPHAAQQSEQPPLRTRRAPGWLAPLIVALGAAIAVVLALIVLPAMREPGRDAQMQRRYPALEIEADQELLGDRLNLRQFDVRLSAPNEWERFTSETLEHLGRLLEEGEAVAGWGSPQQFGLILIHSLTPRYVDTARSEHHGDPLLALKKATVQRSEADDQVTVQAQGAFSVDGIRVTRVEKLRTDGDERMVALRYFVGAPFEPPFGLYVMCHEEAYDKTFQRTFLSVLASIRHLGAD